MARTYKRDSLGRFASGGGSSSSSRPASRGISRGTNRLTRNNAGQITGTGNGATARGGRIRTTAGKQRATQTTRLKGAGGRLRGGNANSAKPVATGKAAGKPKAPPKSATTKAAKKAKPSRQISADKVERIVGRLSSDPNRKQKSMRKSSVMSRNARNTRQRAIDFISKAGGLTVKGKGSRAQNTNGLTRDQLIGNIAQKLAKPTVRSTARNRSKDVQRRQAIRASARDMVRSTRITYLHGRKPSSQNGKFAPGRLRRLPDRVAQDVGTGNYYTDNRGNIFTGRKSFRSKQQAAAAQRIKRRGVQRLRGTGQLGGPASRLRRGKAQQLTLTGGVATTYGRMTRDRRR